MDILNEEIEIIAEIRLGPGGSMKYCHVRYKGDGDSRCPVLIIERADSPLIMTMETSFVIEKDFKDFARKVYLRLDEIEVAKKENKLLKIKDGIFSKKGLDY